MMLKNSIVPIIANLPGLIIGFVLAISFIYTWLIPEFFRGYSSYSILIVGAAIAGACGTYTGFKGYPNRQTLRQSALPFIFGLFVATLVGALSLLIIISVMGI